MLHVYKNETASTRLFIRSRRSIIPGAELISIPRYVYKLLMTKLMLAPFDVALFLYSPAGAQSQCSSLVRNALGERKRSEQRVCALLAEYLRETMLRAVFSLDD